MSRVAVVQGASRGLGLAFVESLCARADVARVFATCRDPEASDGLERLAAAGSPVTALRLDVTDEPSIEAAADRVRDDAGRVHLLLNVAGVLHGPGVRPEKKLEDVDPAMLASVFAVNATGPLLVLKHFVDLLALDERAVVANVSARIGSIGDNRVGGWYAYRASKAAQNMLTRTAAIELGRRAPEALCVALHPGTVDTDLSRPFQRSARRLFPPRRAAEQLLAVIDRLGPDDSGGFFAWDGSPIPW